MSRLLTKQEDDQYLELLTWMEGYGYTAQNALEVMARRMRDEADFCRDQDIRGAERAFRDSAARADQAARMLARLLESDPPDDDDDPADPERGDT